MKTVFVLIVLMYGSGKAVAVHEFGTQEACLKAKEFADGGMSSAICIEDRKDSPNGQ